MVTEISLGLHSKFQGSLSHSLSPKPKYQQQVAIRYIVLCITDVDNQRTEAAILCGNLNIKLWDMKRLGNVKGDMEC